MTKFYYHATPFENLDSIMEKGILRGFDGFVYLADSPTNACKFLTIRGYRDLLVLRVAIEEELVSESYDHNEKFFGCKAYMYNEDIPIIEIDDFLRYEAVLKK